MDLDLWASLPSDLLIDIFHCLDASDLVRCTCTCKPWRRTIIGNVSSLRPRPDCFNPNLLLGFFYVYWNKASIISEVHLQRAPGPFESLLKATNHDDDDDDDEPECPPSFLPAAASAGVNLSSYDMVLSSRDGFLLLDGSTGDYPCLCNPLTGDCTLVPYPDFKEDTCVLVTGYDFDPPNDDPGVRILAMRVDAIFGYVTTLIETATFGPVIEVESERSLKAYKFFDDAEVICRGAVHWLCKLVNGRKCVLALHLSTGRTWTIKLPKQCQQGYCNVLAASRDGRITLVNQSASNDKTIHVWEHIDGKKWTLQRTIHVLPNLDGLNVAFGPRSGWLLAEVCEEEEEELLIDVERGVCRPIMHLYAKNALGEFRMPYEMDWSTYLSKMKQF
ncbi:unnamed protein product [Urochloa decumbens]|uniref:F-box domain-containing protein n=1 Tax=Urochloa decumbens TaxID=240449 RepID=A0ABC9ALX1_9POAL